MERVFRLIFNYIQAIIAITLILLWFLPVRLVESEVVAIGLVVAFGFISFFRFLFLGDGEVESRWGFASLGFAILILVPTFLTALFVK